MSLSRFCQLSVVSRINRYPTSLPFLSPSAENGTHSRVFRVESKRTIFQNHCFWQSAGKNSKNEQLAVSRPRLYRQLEVERAKDNLSADWELIFSLHASRRKLTITHWCAFVSSIVLPFVSMMLIEESKYEESVLFLGQLIPKTTEVGLFVLCNSFLLYVILKNLRNLPYKIYFNEKTERYIALTPSLFPWKVIRTEFESTNIRTLPSKGITPIKLKPWRDNEHLINDKIFIIPHVGFRNGHDRHWMLRYVGWQENFKK